MACTVTRRQPEGKTTKTRKNRGVPESEEVEREPYGDPVDRDEADPPCNVGFSASRTVNLGNYESLRVEVSLHVPCDQEEVDEAFDAAQVWVQERLEKAIPDA
jgi:hypothetical protein